MKNYCAIGKFCFNLQLEGKTEKAQSQTGVDATTAFKREREEHKNLLAESHRLVMDLQWQIQHNEKSWKREKIELLERLDKDRREWERQKKDLLRKVEQVSYDILIKTSPGLCSKGVLDLCLQ